MGKVSPVGSVPVLAIDDVPIAGAMAIGEHAARQLPSLLPDGAQGELARRAARQAATGFPALSAFMPMDFTARFSPPGMLLRNVTAELEQLLTLWQACRDLRQEHGPFLLGRFGLVDAMMAPWAARMVTYGVPLSTADAAYVEALRAFPEWQEWEGLARAERGETHELARPVERPAPVPPIPAHPAHALPATTRPPEWSAPISEATPHVGPETATRPSTSAALAPQARAASAPVDLSRITPGRRPGAVPEDTPRPAEPKLPLRRVKARDTIIAPDPEGRRRRTTLALVLGLLALGAAALTPRSLVTESSGPVALLAPEDDASIRLASPRVVLRYSHEDPAALTAAERVAARLTQDGYRVTAITPASAPVGNPTIRYFSPADRLGTKVLVDRLEATLNRQITAMLVRGAEAGPSSASHRTIEVWLGPLSG
jgi:glutathione S-transferase